MSEIALGCIRKYLDVQCAELPCENIAWHPDGADKYTMPNPPKLFDQVREKLRLTDYAILPVQTCADWIEPLAPLHGKQHPENA